MNYLKKKYGISSNRQLLVILFVFSISGMTSLYVKSFIKNFIGIDDGVFWLFNFLFNIIITFISYQFLLIFYGFILGQFNFFWKFEKRIFKIFYFFKK